MQQPSAASSMRLPEAKEQVNRKLPLVAAAPTPQHSKQQVPVSPQRSLFEASFAPKRAVGEGRSATATLAAVTAQQAAAAAPLAETAKGIRAVVGSAYAEGELVSDQLFLGTVKSYNDRRGFGFLSCAETAASYGRDVYIAKTEAQVAAADGAPSSNGRDTMKVPIGEAEKPAPAPRLAEEDLVQFKVRLSVEGFPQAAQVLRLRKFRGVVIQSPAEASETPAPGGEGLGRIASAELLEFLGTREVAMRWEACGQVRLTPGDEVTFCVPEVEPAPRGAPAKQREAKLVFLMKSSRPMGSVLGCFSLILPRPCLSEGKPQRPDLRLDCHALGDKVILAGLPRDVEEAELSRFFSKQGASGAIVAHARGCSFASISFPSANEVARLLGRTAHAFADDKDTRIAALRPCRQYGATDSSRLPALPAPTLMPCEEAGSLLAVWSPLVLAVGYSVELRPAGGQAAWATVDVTQGRLGAGKGRFDPDCSSCKVNGLHAGTAYEARVTYFTSCGCRAEASDSSERCTPCGTSRRPGVAASQQASWQQQQQQQQPMAQAAAVSPQPQAAAPSWGSNWQGRDAEAQLGMPLAPVPGAMPAGQNMMSPLPAYIPSPGWRCAHGYVVPQPPVPELRPGDEYGFSISVQWPSVAHAAAYVVELREAGSATAERFIRSAPMAAPGSSVELRVGGLRPGGQPGRCYSAQIRCVAGCGCESTSSAAGWSQPLGASSAASGPAQGSFGAITGTPAPAQWSFPQTQQPGCAGSRSPATPEQPAPMQPPAGNWMQTPLMGYQQPGMPAAMPWSAAGSTDVNNEDGIKGASGAAGSPAVPAETAPANGSPVPPLRVAMQEECLILD